MPGGDRTGPTGQGPMTGRAAGYCTGSPGPGYMNPAPGRGSLEWEPRGGFWGRGRGGGCGRRNRYYATGIPGRARAGRGFGPPVYPSNPVAPSMTGEQELELLRKQADYFGETLKDIKQRIEELGGQETQE